MQSLQYDIFYIFVFTNLQYDMLFILFLYPPYKFKIYNMI